MNQPLTQRIIQWAPVLMVMILVVLYAWSFVYSVWVLDSSRDLFRATQISQFTHFPALGPDIGGFFHTGPVWFYLLAIPALLGSLSSVALFVGVLAGLKFVFAYQLGRQLLDRRFGLVWAFMLLLPGWQVLSQVFINHTNLLETLSLLFLLLLCRWHQTGGNKYGLMSALVLGLGFHAHPVFLAMMVFYLPLIAGKKISFNFPFWAMFWFLFLLPLLPYLTNQLLHGFPDWARFVERDAIQNQILATGSSANSDVNFLTHWMQNLKAIIWGGPVRIISFVTEANPQWGAVFIGFVSMVVLCSLLGLVAVLFGLGQYNRRLLITLCLLLCALLLITLLRGFTPFYMLLPLTALFHGVLALGFYVVIKRLNHWFVYLFFLGFVFIGVTPIRVLHETAVKGQINLGPVMNVNAQLSDGWMQQQNTLDVLSVNESRSVAAYFCDQSMVLNGPLSSVLDVTGVTPLIFYCDDFDLILGGQPMNGSRAVFVMHQSFWAHTTVKPKQWISNSWGLIDYHKNIGPVKGLTPAVFDDYIHPPRSNHDVTSAKTHQFEFTAPNLNHVIFSNILPFNVQFKVDEVTANGLPVELLVANAANRLYHCDRCQSRPIIWRVTLTSNDINAIDINVF